LILPISGAGDLVRMFPQILFFKDRDTSNIFYVSQVRRIKIGIGEARLPVGTRFRRMRKKSPRLFNLPFLNSGGWPSRPFNRRFKFHLEVSAKSLPSEYETLAADQQIL